MITFLIGLAILFVGGFFYGKYCDKVFGPDDRETPAITMNFSICSHEQMEKFIN